MSSGMTAAGGRKYKYRWNRLIARASFQVRKTLTDIMKTSGIFRLCAVSLLLNSLVWNQAAAQNTRRVRENNEAAAIRSLVESKHYIFKARMVLPAGGRPRYLTSDYSLRVMPDSIIAWLPYFGRAYTAPANLIGGGIQFTSTNFNYAVKDRKKGGWDVMIKPTDQRDVQQLSLSITEDGYASLQVISNSRQAISFNGILTESARAGN